jgi:hypothetical protein
MRPNIWIVVGILIVLFAMTRYLRDQKTLQICVNDPTASVCERRPLRVTLRHHHTLSPASFSEGNQFSSGGFGGSLACPTLQNYPRGLAPGSPNIPKLTNGHLRPDQAYRTATN